MSRADGTFRWLGYHMRYQEAAHWACTVDRPERSAQALGASAHLEQLEARPALPRRFRRLCGTTEDEPDLASVEGTRRFDLAIEGDHIRVQA